MLGFRDYDLLPNYCAFFDVAWLPVIHNNYTKTMFPMKFFEYLASGLPVISTNIKSLTEFKELTFLSDNPDELSNYILTAINNKNDNIEKSLDLARQNTYKKRTLLMLNEIMD